MMTIANIVGARPQFVKAAALSHAMAERNTSLKPCTEWQIRDLLIHTGQHYDYEMSQVFFDELNLREPDHYLGIGSGSHGQQTGEMLKALEQVFESERPDVVLVYGDTNSTLAAALAAAKMHIPIAHIEAGLRSYNRRMPEEINRVMTDHVSSMLFCPCASACANLQKEGIVDNVHMVGDVMYDVIKSYLPIADAKIELLDKYGVASKKFALATIHRAENTDDLGRLQGIVNGLRRVSVDGREVLLPIHPRTRNVFAKNKISLDGIRLLEPLPYVEMLCLLKHAAVTMTDSGGLQKEAFWAGTPCVTLRDETEWTETVNAGWNTLVGADTEKIVAAANKGIPQITPNLYGDGNAAEKILDIILNG